jgi:hypothetical protein
MTVRILQKDSPGAAIVAAIKVGDGSELEVVCRRIDGRWEPLYALERVRKPLPQCFTLTDEAITALENATGRTSNEFTV